MRGTVLETVQRYAFEDPQMRELAQEPGTRVGDFLERADALTQSASASERDAKSAAAVARMIRGFKQ